MRRLDEIADLPALALGQLARRGRLVAQALVKRGVGREAGCRHAAQLALAPEVAVEQPHLAGTGVDRRLAPGRRVVARRHDIGRGADRVRPGHLEIVEDAVDAFGLDPFGHHRDAEKTAHREPAELKTKRNPP
ncbi:MAG: hypothetical protein R3D25_16890 [Geminicoccaceae bacterium]